MKSPVLLAFILCLVVQCSLSQQITDGGLELWQSFGSFAMPDSFFTSDQLNVPFFGISTVAKTTDAHSGQFAAYLHTETAPDSNVLAGTLGYGSIQMTGSGNFFWGWPFTARPKAVTFWYKYSPAGKDQAHALVLLTKWAGARTTIGTGLLMISAATSAYTEGQIPITYSSSETPDTMDLTFISSGNPNPTAGTKMYIDDIALDYTAGVSIAKIPEPAGFALDQNYPNPFNPSTDIRYVIPRSSRVRLEVFSVLGQSVATLVDAIVPAGIYTVRFDGTRLSSGVYYYRLTAGEFWKTLSLLLIR